MDVASIEINTKAKQLWSQFWSKVKVTSYSTLQCIVQQISFIINQVSGGFFGGGRNVEATNQYLIF